MQVEDEPLTLNYHEGERALCFHGPLMYEAKIQKAEIWDLSNTETGDVGPHYFVHYKGWKQSWDEWVPEERLKKFTEENIKAQKQLIEAQRARDAAAAKSEQEAARRANAAARAKETGVDGKQRGLKRGREAEQEEEWLKRPEIKIAIPDVLKGVLVDDWEAITKDHMLHVLPNATPVDTIITEWLKYLQNDEIERRRLAAEVGNGLRLYFNKALGNNLLYRFERGQYSEAVKPQAVEVPDESGAMTVVKRAPEPSSIYGAVHLLRLFVNLPELLAHTTMDAETVLLLKDHIAHFLGWMVINKDMLYKPNMYKNTPTGYQNNNRA